jgi:hypothetical protein
MGTTAPNRADITWSYEVPASHYANKSLLATILLTDWKGIDTHTVLTGSLTLSCGQGINPGHQYPDIYFILQEVRWCTETSHHNN